MARVVETISRGREARKFARVEILSHVNTLQQQYGLAQGPQHKELVMRKLRAVAATAFVAAAAALFSLPAVAAPAAGSLAGAGNNVAQANAGSLVEKVHRYRRHRGLSFHFGVGVPRYYGYYGYRPYRYYNAYPYYYSSPRRYYKRKYRRHHRHW